MYMRTQVLIVCQRTQNTSTDAVWDTGRIAARSAEEGCTQTITAVVSGVFTCRDGTRFSL